jgi:hypothetical protein
LAINKPYKEKAETQKFRKELVGLTSQAQVSQKQERESDYQEAQRKAKAEEFPPL